MGKTSRLAAIHRKLLAHHGAQAGPGLTDPFELVLWVQVAYLVADERRLAAFRLLEKRVGLAPKAVAKAKLAVLQEVAAAGGSIGVDLRAVRMQESARRVLEEWDGDLAQVLALPLAAAVKALKKFAMIGKPGAEEILLLAGAYPVLALDSNGMRVLLRLGYGAEDPRYERTYASVRAATQPEERPDAVWMASLHHLLRRHGKEICRRSKPLCGECPLAGACPWHAENG
ncbi:MAG TPA: hypothetical protein VGC54_13995 [Planctomycetota bacterium]